MYPWLAAPKFLDAAWRLHRERFPDAPTATHGEDFQMMPDQAHVEMLGEHRGEVRSFDWAPDDDGKQRQQEGRRLAARGGGKRPLEGGGEQAPGGKRARPSGAGGGAGGSAAAAQHRRQHSGGGFAADQPALAGGAGGEAAAAVGAEGERVAAPAPGVMDADAGSQEERGQPAGSQEDSQVGAEDGWEQQSRLKVLPFPLPRAFLSESGKGHCTLCGRRHRGVFCGIRFPWVMDVPLQRVRAFWWQHRKAFPDLPTAQHEFFTSHEVDEEGVVRLVKLVGRKGPGSGRLLAVLPPADDEQQQQQEEQEQEEEDEEGLGGWPAVVY